MCHLELSLDTRLKKSAGVSVRARVWVLVIPPAAITSTKQNALSLSISASLGREGLGAASSGRWMATLGSLNKCDYTC